MKSKKLVIYLRRDESEIMIHPTRYNKNKRLIIKSGTNDGKRTTPNKLTTRMIMKILREECD